MIEDYKILFYISWFIGIFLSFACGMAFGVGIVFTSEAKNLKELVAWCDEDENGN